MMSEYRHKHKKDWFTEVRTVKKVLENVDVASKKYPGFVNLKSFVCLMKFLFITLINCAVLNFCHYLGT